jgi:hypothetical protein
MSEQTDLVATLHPIEEPPTVNGGAGAAVEKHAARDVPRDCAKNWAQS